MTENKNFRHDKIIDSYEKAGVDIEAGNRFIDKIKPLVRATARSGCSGEIGGFGGIFDLKALNYKDPLLVAANDGVGTKVKIAIESGYHQTIGIDLVAMCVNDIIVQGAEPLFFLDYYATGKLDSAVASEVVAGIAEGCKLARCALMGGETAEMPGLYAGKDYDLAGFCVGIVERGSLLPRDDVAVGDVVLALPASGLHSNGFSLVRSLVQNLGLDWHEPSPFDADGHDLAQSLLIPTSIYVQPLLQVLQQTEAIKAMAHITGGGFVDNIPRVLPRHCCAVIDLDLVRVPPVFSWVAGRGRISEFEMIRTFNCGVGMVLVVAHDQVAPLMGLLNRSEQAAYRIGKIVARSAMGEAIQFAGTLAL